MKNMKRQKELTLKDESPRLAGVQYATGEDQRAKTNSSRKNEAYGSKQKNAKLWMCPVVKVSSTL